MTANRNPQEAQTTEAGLILFLFFAGVLLVASVGALGGTYVYHTFIAPPHVCPDLATLERYAMYERLRQRIIQVNPKRAKDAAHIADVILTAALDNEVKPYLLGAVVEQETRYNVEAIGAAGERGMTQIKKSTAAVLELPWDKAFDPYLNADAGARYLAQHLKTYPTVAKALARYNGGSMQYATEVMARYAEIAGNTHTFVTLGLSDVAYGEIAQKLRAAGYDHCFTNEDGAIDMHGIGVIREKEEMETT
jgi:hypothetical protein